MNTLSRAMTAQILTDPQLYSSIRQRWSDWMRCPRNHELTAAHHLLYLCLMGKDWRKGFTCVSNPRKLANGGYYNWRLHRALRELRFRRESDLLVPFDGLVTPQMLQQIRELVPQQNLARYTPEQFSDGNFPFDAYMLPASVEPTNESDRDA